MEDFGVCVEGGCEVEWDAILVGSGVEVFREKI